MAITGIFNILLENWIVIAVGFVAIFLLFKLLKKEKKPEFKEIDRAEIERKNYINLKPFSVFQTELFAVSKI